MIDKSREVVIVGATGLLGRQLVNSLLESGYKPVVLSRNPIKAQELFGGKVDVQLWNGADVNSLMLLISGAKAIINLAGESIATRWTRKKKDSILKSRVVTTSAIVAAIKQCASPPDVFIQASAIGYYPHNSRLQVDEGGLPGSGFLSQVVMQWEQAAVNVEDRSRLVIIRTGVVLSATGGFLSKLVLPIRFFVGAWFGRGSQMLSWIHIKDHARAICFLLDHDNCRGVYNLVSPEPRTIKSFVKQLGAVLKRPVWLTIPAFVLTWVFGEMADEVILSNQNVIPQRLIQAGFEFEFNDVDNALEDLYKQNET